MIEEILSKLYTAAVGTAPSMIEELPRSGSNRRYYRLHGTSMLIGVWGESITENQTFIYMARHFKAQGLPVPCIVAVDEHKQCYLQEDLGNTLLFDAIEQGRVMGTWSDQQKQLLKKSMHLLADIQFKGAQGFDFKQCHPQEEFNRRSIMWDLNYFKYSFLKATGIAFEEDLLEDDFEQMANVLLSKHYDSFMYRDFQSRNVMVKDGEPWLIDFQGGRRGPYHYDVASFIWQAKANYPNELRHELVDAYLDALQTYVPNLNREHFHNRLRHFVLFRTLQVLGAYGFRGYFEKKPHFIESIPFAIENLRTLLAKGYPEYPYLNKLLLELTELKQFKEKPKKPLVVRVMSFSYKRGIPEDPSGNGGGFVFDCRAITNPGKYDRYKNLTGLDAPVIEFLEDNGEITDFLSHISPVVDASVKRYMERGFNSLSVCFGCTGGQHRSVYCAQHLAEHLNKRFGVEVHLMHREQNINQTFSAK